MKSKINLLLILTMIISYTWVFAAVEVNDSWVKTDSVNIETWIDDDTNFAWDELDTEVEVWLNAAWDEKMVVAPKWSVWNYSEVACDKDYFTQNTCNQCFEWGKKMSGEKIAWLTDSWTNPNSTEQIIYKWEQSFPELINLWWEGTKWVNNPIESEKFWKYNDEIVWTDSATGPGVQEFLLEWGRTVNFLEADLWASYALESSNKNEWDPIGLLKFYINYHDTDASARESDVKTHIECVAYYSWNPVIAEVKKPTPVTPKEVTKVKTGPEAMIFVIAALLVSLAIMSRRKKV